MLAEGRDYLFQYSFPKPGLLELITLLSFSCGGRYEISWEQHIWQERIWKNGSQTLTERDGACTLGRMSMCSDWTVSKYISTISVLSP